MSVWKSCTVVVVGLLIGALGCSGSKDEPTVTNDSSELSKVIRTASITPKQVRANHIVEVNFKRAVNPESFEYTWYRNGEAIDGADEHRLDPYFFLRGDELAVQITVPETGESFRTSAVEVSNSPPQILSANASVRGSGGEAEIVAIVNGKDVDNDPINYTYRWHRNSTVMSGQSGQSISMAGIGAGDVVYAEIIASDNMSQSPTFRTPPVRVDNHPPRILSQPGAPSGQNLVYQVQADDADGDRLQYSLLEAPDGMTIDSTGLLQWQLPTGEARTGSHKVTIQVSDAKGGIITQSFSITF